MDRHNRIQFPRRFGDPTQPEKEQIRGHCPSDEPDQWTDSIALRPDRSGIFQF